MLAQIKLDHSRTSSLLIAVEAQCKSVAISFVWLKQCAKKIVVYLNVFIVNYSCNPGCNDLAVIQYIFETIKVDNVLLSKFQNNNLEEQFPFLRPLNGAKDYISYYTGPWKWEKINI